MKRGNVLVTWIRAGGPGGQHRNKTETGVRLRHIPTGIVVTASERRSRRANLEVAYARLDARLEALTRKRKPRIRTRPTRASVERRLQEKKARSRKKELRRDGEA